MKIYFGFGAIAIVAVLAFQNCNKRPSSIDESAGQQEALVNRVDMSVADVSKIDFYVPDVQTAGKPGHTYSLKYNKTLSINMITGVITESNDVNSSTRTYCLPEEMKAELVAILEASQVCMWGNTSGSGVMCGMAMQLPYAEVRMGNEIMGLGSATDTCGNNAVNLCDSRDEVLKAFIDKLNANYSSYSCN